MIPTKNVPDKNEIPVLKTKTETVQIDSGVEPKTKKIENNLATAEII